MPRSEREAFYYRGTIFSMALAIEDPRFCKFALRIQNWDKFFFGGELKKNAL